jgi:hypothetical protein
MHLRRVIAVLSAKSMVRLNYATNSSMASCQFPDLDAFDFS